MPVVQRRSGRNVFWDRQAVFSRLQRPYEQGSDLGRYSTSDDQRAVGIGVVQERLIALLDRLPGQLFGIQRPAVPPHDVLDMARRAMERDVEQVVLVCRRRNPGQLTDLEITEPSRCHLGRNARQPNERPRRPHLFPRRPERDPALPVEPVRERLHAPLGPAAAPVELRDQRQEPCIAGIQMPGKRRDLIHQLGRGNRRELPFHGALREAVFIYSTLPYSLYNTNSYCTETCKFSNHKMVAFVANRRPRCQDASAAFLSDIVPFAGISTCRVTGIRSRIQSWNPASTTPFDDRMPCV